MQTEVSRCFVCDDARCATDADLFARALATHAGHTAWQIEPWRASTFIPSLKALLLPHLPPVIVTPVCCRPAGYGWLLNRDSGSGWGRMICKIRNRLSHVHYLMVPQMPKETFGDCWSTCIFVCFGILFLEPTSAIANCVKALRTSVLSCILRYY